jgi:hypothetical protein
MKKEKIRKGKGSSANVGKRPEKRWLIAPAAIAAAVVIALAGTLLSGLAGISDRDGLRMMNGRWTGYRDRGGSAWLSLHRAGADVWGFFEWGDERVYGLFDGSWKDVTGKGVTLSPAGGEGWVLHLGRGFLPGSLSARISGPEMAEKTLRMRRDRSNSLRISGFSGSFDAAGRSPGLLNALFMPSSIRAMPGPPGSSHFHVDTIAPGTPAPGNPFDRRLRRSLNASGYAGALWSNFRKDWKAQSGERPSRQASLAERQYFVSYSHGMASVMTERYVYSGGAHGITTMMCDIFDPRTGDPVDAARLFRPGWEEAVGNLLREEALRLRGASETGLLAAGFFEDRIPATGSIFLGNSGIGFHYDRYELAPYAQGDFLFMLPWSALSGVLVP